MIEKFSCSSELRKKMVKFLYAGLKQKKKC